MLRCATGRDYQDLLRPMMIDTFIADDSSEDIKAELQAGRRRLIEYVSKFGAEVIFSLH